MKEEQRRGCGVMGRGNADSAGEDADGSEGSVSRGFSV